MPDWKGIVRKELASGLPPHVMDEIIGELAAHLEDTYEGGVESGLTESEAEREALAGIRWRRLARKIHRVKLGDPEPGRSIMNQRTRKLWLPALAGLMLTAVLLVIFDKIHAGTLAVRLGHLAMAFQLAWFAAMPVAGQTKLEEAMMNRRTRSIWLPGFVSLTAASLFLFAEEIVLAHDPSFCFNYLSLQPDHLIISRVAWWFYVGWLLTQFFCGAVGAFLSRRGGGSLGARTIAATFPAIVMLALWTLVIPMSALAGRNAFLWHHPLYYLLGIFVWVVSPGLALLAGAVPFLKASPAVNA
jgi:hypothetical protein